MHLTKLVRHGLLGLARTCVVPSAGYIPQKWGVRRTPHTPRWRRPGYMSLIASGSIFKVCSLSLLLCCRRDRMLQQRTKEQMTRMYPGAADMNVDDYHHVAMSTETPPVISKFLPLNAESSAAIVAHYDTTGRLTDLQPYTGSCAGGWHPTLSVMDPTSAAAGTGNTTCYPPSNAVRLTAAPGGTSWQLRRHADQEHEYELPK